MGATEPARHPGPTRRRRTERRTHRFERGRCAERRPPVHDRGRRGADIDHDVERASRESQQRRHVLNHRHS